MATSEPDFYMAALEYFREGYTAIPLTKDPFGFPKRPIPLAWSSLPHVLETVKALAWEGASGIGIVLGATSQNLAVIDVDDVAMAEIVAPKCRHTRVVKSIRNRCHVYVRERSPSRSRKLTVRWQGRDICIELKCAGNQVAAPPTPGYKFISDADPKEVECVWDAWKGIARIIGVEPGESENFPHPWQRTVPAQQRNKSAYIEAHKLREARMPLEDALRIMQVRWHQDYEKGEQTWDEVARTIESAYQKGVKTDRWYGGVPVEL